ncbi:MAG: hypothetical protein IMF12_02005 [Proteobacteria bacterium]|nr:hypothetical protein [Pseudomonadota bacterium]
MQEIKLNAFKLELLKHHTNHFALKTKLYLKAVQPSFLELRKLSALDQLLFHTFLLLQKV